MASKTAKRVRANVGRAAAVRGGDGAVTSGEGPLLPDFEPTDRERPHSLDVHRRGIRTASDVIDFMTAMIGDVFEDRLSVEKAKTANSSMGRVLKAAEMQQRYGRQVGRNGEKSFVLRQPALPNAS